MPNKEKSNATDREAEAKPKEKFYFPEIDRTIEAESFEAAVEIVNQTFKK